MNDKIFNDLKEVYEKSGEFIKTSAIAKSNFVLAYIQGRQVAENEITSAANRLNAEVNEKHLELRVKEVDISEYNMNSNVELRVQLEELKKMLEAMGEIQIKIEV